MRDDERILKDDAEATLRTLESRLLAQFDPNRPWTGYLSDSAVATSVAVFALCQVNAVTHRRVIQDGLRWLAHTQNADGGWGDSPESPSNLTATLLAWCALGQTGLVDADPSLSVATRPCERWLAARLGTLAPESIAAGVIARYGGDRTFPAPLLALAAIAGRMGPPDSAWTHVPQLPFELAALPNWCFRWLNLTVVSYALPALISVGLVRHRRCPTRLVPLRKIRDRLRQRLLNIALSMQPSNGGYEEATPLTAFVTLSLAAAGYQEHPIVHAGVRFLLASQRDNGSWPIDTDLATWVTVQAVMALTSSPRDATLPAPHRQAIHRWLLAQQYSTEHPLTFGAPGGWGWTDLPGAMPDADDTAGVLLALQRLGPSDPDTLQAVEHGIQWLLNLQNRDGGIPTFARGWGKLPFDRSCPDITAHAMHAFLAWLSAMPPTLRARMRKRIRRMARYLETSQSAQGSWVPLWFGTQAAPDECNHTYGTAKTVISLRAAYDLGFTEVKGMLNLGQAFLVAGQNPDGGWGAKPGLPSSLEETSVTLSALAEAPYHDVLTRGVRWLVDTTRQGWHTPASPVGLYFARLWYSEELYPIIFATSALAKALPKY